MAVIITRSPSSSIGSPFLVWTNERNPRSRKRRPELVGRELGEKDGRGLGHGPLEQLRVEMVPVEMGDVEEIGLESGEVDLAVVGEDEPGGEVGRGAPWVAEHAPRSVSKNRPAWPVAVILIVAGHFKRPDLFGTLRVTIGHGRASRRDRPRDGPRG